MALLTGTKKGVEGVKVKLEDASTTVTDKDGHYFFPSVGAGKHVVMLDAARIPPAYTFIGAETATVEVKNRGRRRVDFPFVLGAGIRGRPWLPREMRKKQMPRQGSRTY